MREYLAMLQWPTDGGHVVLDVGEQKRRVFRIQVPENLCLFVYCHSADVKFSRPVIFFSRDFSRRPGFVRSLPGGRISGRIPCFRNRYRFAGVTRMIQNPVVCSFFLRITGFFNTIEKISRLIVPGKRTAACWCTISFYILLSHDYPW